ncbi:Hypothetical predicted protein [Xyrichtys novacula]|uniref:Uncharacterized protein n=1 Tax=Xyrichtys novacula TaxID=13765 RepID=A0AAV1GIS2_XYRNO|nr:Hypothetical predicted protein [Xyrichtys novacula]
MECRNRTGATWSTEDTRSYVQVALRNDQFGRNLYESKVEHRGCAWRGFSGALVAHRRNEDDGRSHWRGKGTVVEKDEERWLREVIKGCVVQDLRTHAHQSAKYSPKRRLLMKPGGNVEGKLTIALIAPESLHVTRSHRSRPTTKNPKPPPLKQKAEAENNLDTCFDVQHITTPLRNQRKKLHEEPEHQPTASLGRLIGAAASCFAPIGCGGGNRADSRLATGMSAATAEHPSSYLSSVWGSS